MESEIPQPHVTPQFGQILCFLYHQAYDTVLDGTTHAQKYFLQTLIIKHEHTANNGRMHRMLYA